MSFGFVHSLASSRRSLAFAAFLCAAVQASAHGVINPVTGETDTYAYKYVGVGTWTAADWQDANGDNPPAAPQVAAATQGDPTCFGSLLVDGVQALSADIEGWTFNIGLFGGAELTVPTLNKWQGGCSASVDKDSRLVIQNLGSGNYGGDINFYVAAQGGVTYGCDYAKAGAFYYHLAGKGSVAYQNLTGGSHTIKAADIALSAPAAKKVKRKTLVSFSSTDRTFAAVADVKVKDGDSVLETVFVNSVRSSGESIANTVSELTTSDDAGSCEIVQCADGVVIFWVDGDPGEIAPKTYSPSININFTNGDANGLTTAADVGLAGYEVPGVSWNNLTIPNNANEQTFATVNSVDSTGATSVESGVSVTVSSHRGSYSCSTLTPAGNPLHGYIDEGLEKLTPTVTVTGLSYYKYRVVVYAATDANTKTFGYITINGTNYTYVDNALIEGTEAWGNSGAQNDAEPLAEGVNVLVTGEISGPTLTVVGHRNGNDTRGCIAAIQIIEVKPEITVNDLEIPVSGETVYPVSETKDLSGTVYLTGNGTLTLDGTAKISAATIDVGHSVVLKVNADRLDGTTFVGSGTVVYEGVVPPTGKGWTDSTWTGTVWFKNYATKLAAFNTNPYGNAGSTLRLTGLNGYFQRNSSVTHNVPIELVDDGETPAWTYNDGWGGSVVAFAVLKGDGTFKTVDKGNGEIIYFADPTGFTGSFDLAMKKIVLGGETPAGQDAYYYGKVVVAGTATVSSTSTWRTGNGGFEVSGTLYDNGTLLSSKATGAIIGSGTVVFGGVPSPVPAGDEDETKWWKHSSWTGTVEISGVTDMDGSDYAFSEYGHAGSTVKLTNCSGSLRSDYTCVPQLEIGGVFTWNDGVAGLTNAFKVGTLKGSGTISIPNGGAATAVWQVTDDWSGFTGAVIGNTIAAARAMVFGSTLPASVTAGGIYVSEGATLDLNNASAAWWGVGMRFIVDGTIKASARSKWGGGTAMTLNDTGVLELTSSSNVDDTADNTADFSNVTGTGTIKYSSTAGWRTFLDNEARMPPTTLTIQTELANSLIISRDAGRETVIGNLAGSKNIRSDWNPSGGSAENNPRTLTVTQSKDTEWQGSFVANRITRFNVVAPSQGTAGTLTLSGTQTANIPMQVDGKVNLTGTWVGSMTVSGTIGGTGTLSGDLTFDAGATFKVFDTNVAFTVSGSLSYPVGGGKIKVDLSGIDFENLDYFPIMRVADADASMFEFANAAYPFEFTFADGVLGLRKLPAVVWQDHVTFTLTGIGPTPIANYTLLLRVSETLLPGFSYSRAGDGTMLAFIDEEHGFSMWYDVDTWNPGGESLIWVKVPEAADGTKIRFCWSPENSAAFNVNGNDPTQVWSEYAGVWHMNDATDSTVNQMGGVIGNTSSIVSGGAFGSAVRSSGDGEPLLLADASTALNDLTNGTFTITFWTYLNSVSDGSSSSQYLFSRRKTWNDDDGYALFLHPRAPDESANLGVACGAAAYRYTTVGPVMGLIRDGWMRNDVVYSREDAKFYWYINGVRDDAHGFTYAIASYGSNPFANGAEDKIAIGGRLVSGSGANSNLNGAIDEFRMRSGAIDTALMAVEMSNMTFTDYLHALEGDGTSFLVPGMVTRGGEQIDYWAKKPTMSPAFWEVGSSPAVTITGGALRSGSTITNWCVNAITGEIATNEITAAAIGALPVGTYALYYDSMGALPVDRVEIYFSVTAESGESNLGGSGEGRILLMNDHCFKPEEAFKPEEHYLDEPRYQSWFYSDDDGFHSSDTPTFWQHMSNYGIDAFNLKDSTESILWTSNYSSKVWHLLDCRHGNTYPTNNVDALSEVQNYLPYDTEFSISIENGEEFAERKGAGQIVMRNSVKAGVYSPLYTNGIGTVYFDAVNGWNDNILSYTNSTHAVNSNAYQIVVEIAKTNTVGAVAGDDVAKDSVSGDWAYGNLCWEACTMYPVRVSEGSNLSAKDPVMTLSLDVEDGGTAGEFYRVYVPINEYGPVRFRIRRASVDTTDREDAEDVAFLLLDNIIASPPPMKAELEQAGWYDPTKKGKSVLGQENAFNLPFPAVGDTIYGRAIPKYYVGSWADPGGTNFISSAWMKYRWRYLDQNVEDWKTVALNPLNGFYTVSPLVLPGLVGDVEFRFEAALQAPYYTYYDYSGLNLGVGGFHSESITYVSCAANADYGYYPTCGTDWFVRLREAGSVKELWRLHVTKADGSAYDVDGNGAAYADFELTEAGSWRAFVKTPKTIQEGLRYRIDELNPQVLGSDGFSFSTNCWSGAIALIDDTRSTTLVAGDTNNWSSVGCPGTTGYLMFTLDEGKSGTPSIAVTSADMQSFNGWNDANKSSMVFVGSSAEDGDDGKSGVSPEMRVYEDGFESWRPCNSTNPSFWTERFNQSFDERFKAYSLFSSAVTPNGWNAGPGMWVHQEFRDVGMAYEMQGRGMGYLLFQNSGVTPRGIERVSFKSRLSQSISLDDFTYSETAVGDRSMTNYTFIVQAAMSPVAAKSADIWNADFDGLGQISILGGYRRDRGGYELRLTRIRENRYRAELYKWVRGTAELVNWAEANLNYTMSPLNIRENSSNSKLYATYYMSISYEDGGNSCKVQAGFTYGDPTDTSESYATDPHAHTLPGEYDVLSKYTSLAYWDAAPPTKYGSFGFGSANCPAVFEAPRLCNKAAEWLDSTVAKGVSYALSGRFTIAKLRSDLYPIESQVHDTDQEGLYEDEWRAVDRLKLDGEMIRAYAPEQPLVVEWAPLGSEDWNEVTNITVAGFALSKAVNVPLYSTEDAQVRIRHGGDISDDNLVDITLDDIEIRQWRGDSYDSDDQAEYAQFYDSEHGAPTNFVYTSVWVGSDGTAELSAKRTSTNQVSSIRSPLMDGQEYDRYHPELKRGLGLGMFAFSYTNADENAVLKLQIWTNDVSYASLKNRTADLPDDVRWSTVTNYVFRDMSEEERKGGVMAYYLGLHGVAGAMRLVVDQDVVDAAKSSANPAYGRVFVTQVVCRDEPELGTGCWWGWNLRTGTDLFAGGDDALMQLGDYSSSSFASKGMSAALNSSVYDDIYEPDAYTYRQHQPFIQTPVLTNGTEVGQFTFKARRYDPNSAYTARVSVYGACPKRDRTNLDNDSAWTYLTHFDINSATYTNCSFKAKTGHSYEVLRFVVVGMGDVEQEHGNPSSDPCYMNLDEVVRVALDDIVVTEALRPKVSFRNVFAFRSDPEILGPETDFLSRHAIDGSGNMAMQPLARENWGIQAEVYAAQLAEEIDFDRGVSVTLYWYDGGYMPWGFSNWEGSAKKVKLAPCDDNPLVFRSSFADGYMDSVLPEREPGTVVQYMLKVEYYTFDSEDPLTLPLSSEDWVKPAWYRGIDYNNKQFAAAKSFAAYCLFDSIPAGWAWLNEVNMFGGFGTGDSNLDENRQYVEVAMPAEADLTDWTIDFISKNGVTNTVCRFGTDARAKKNTNVASNCVFLVVSSPASSNELSKLTVDGKKVEVDGVWHFANKDGWSFSHDEDLGYWYPIAAQLVRPSGVIEHQIVFEGTNMYAGIDAELGREYSAVALADALNAADPEGVWKAVGDDSLAGDRSLGETGRSADSTSCWTNTMARTPGFINKGQVIDPNHPTANGTSYIIYAYIDPESEQITQTFGDAPETRELVSVVAQKGTSKDITYNIGNWYELASVSVNDKDIVLPDVCTGRVQVTLGGLSTSNNLTVVAKSRVNPVLESEWDLKPDDRYAPAIVSWLNKGTRLDGSTFNNPAGPLVAAKLVPLSGRPPRDMTLKEMYWLDIDPTGGDWGFTAGMIDPPRPVVVTPEYERDHDAENNVRMGVYMCITNGAGARFAPYVIRGVAPDETSWAYTAGEFLSWSGATFKITGVLANNLPSNVGWVPLRWFVFGNDSFNPAGTDVEFQSSIEVIDPYSTESPGYAQGWSTWRDRANVFYSWSIEDGRSVFEVKTLCPTNWISQ